MSPSPVRARAVAVICAVVVTVVDYLTLLGWHRLQQYVTWRVWVLAFVLTVMVAVAGWLGAAVPAATAVTVTLTALWSLDAASDPGVDGANLWPIGAMGVFAAAGAGSFVVAAASSGARERFARRGTRPNAF